MKTIVPPPKKKTMIMKQSIILLAALLAAPAMAQQQQGPQQKKVYMVSDAHLDTQWNWDVQATIKDHLRSTISQNLYLLKTYPDYIFNFEGGVKYAWMKEYYPQEFSELKKYVANGRWHLAGSAWDANETVICSPESWLRNVLLGQTFYRQEFGKEGTDIFLPDCFGFGYDLPTLAAHCGLIGFSSQKLGWRTNAFYPDGRKYPFPVGLWRGIDGSCIMMVHGFNYSQHFDDQDLSHNGLLQKEMGESPLGVIYRYYGTGDIGGSPDVSSVRALEKGIHGDGPLKIISATSDQLYKDYLPFDKHPELPVADGEMTMDVHGNACYTSQAAMKLYNRQNEHLGDAAERASVMAEHLGTGRYPLHEMTANWQRMIWNQFHDDVTGTCIPRAYEFAWNDELLSLGRFSANLTTAIKGVASRLNTTGSGTPLVLYNNESFPMRSVAHVVLPQGATSATVTNAEGKTVLSQTVTDSQGRRLLLFDADTPPVGVSVYHMKTTAKAQRQAPVEAKAIENSIYRLTVNADGDISSIIDKRQGGRQLVAPGKAIGLVMFDDCHSYAWPAWEILQQTLDKAPRPVNGNVRVTLAEQGPLRQTLCVSKTYGQSTFKQYISLYEGSQAHRIDIYNEVEWHELNALLKANFPLAVSNEKASYDLGLGHIERGNNRPQAFEVYAHEWTDLTDASGAYGVTILNDSKYGWDKPSDNTLRLSLLYAPKAKDGYVYQERQDMGFHAFTYSIVGHAGALDGSQATLEATKLNSPVRTFVTAPHKGDLGRAFSFLSTDNENVMVRALKKSELGDTYVIRVYENGGKQAQTAHIRFAADIIRAEEADGTEKTVGPATAEGNTLTIHIKPFSVKTYKVTLRGHAQRELDSQSVGLPFNLRCFSPNGYRSAANFSGGYAYAAELLPDTTFTVDGVPFTFGDKHAENGVSCNGQTIALPAGKGYNRVYLLAASRDGDRKATFTLGKTRHELNICDYHEFYGQWGHEGQTDGWLKDAEVAYVGTHRHSATADEPYEFTYMFKYALDIPKGATSLVLPADPDVVVFAVTVTREDAAQQLQPAAPLFRTGNKSDEKRPEAADTRANLLTGAKVIACSGETNDRERAVNLIDGKLDTKWCDVGQAPNYVAFDLGKTVTASAWQMVNAGQESNTFITRSCLLQGRNSPTDEWATLDMIDGNTRDVVKRNFNPTAVRYIRLFVTGPTQTVGTNAARVYELKLF